MEAAWLYMCLVLCVATEPGLSAPNVIHTYTSQRRVDHGAIRTRRVATGTPSSVEPNPGASSSAQVGFDITMLTSDGEAGYLCGDGWCRCNSTYADCSDINLHYIPRLPPGITSLDFLRKVYLPYGLWVTNTFLTNATNVTWLDMSWTVIAGISPHAFDRLARLNYLAVGGTQLSCHDLSVLLRIPTLQTLRMWTVWGCEQFEDTGVTTPMPVLEYLDLQNTYFSSINATYLSLLNGLKRVCLSDLPNIARENFRSVMQVLSKLPSLTALDVSNNNMPCDVLSVALTIRSLEVLRLQETRDCDIFPDVSRGDPLPALRQLDLSNSLFKLVSLNRLAAFTRLTRLRAVYISGYSSKRKRSTSKILSDLFSSDLVLPENYRSGERVGEAHVATDRRTEGITHFESLRQLSQLAYLDLSGNALSCGDLRAVLTVPSLEEFRARNGIRCKHPRLDLLAGNNTRLRIVDLSQNHFDSVAFLSQGDLGVNPVLCGSNSSPIVQSLLEIDLSDSDLRSLHFSDPNPACLPRRTALNMRGNRMLEYLVFTESPVYQYFRYLEILNISAQTYSLDKTKSFLHISRKTFENSFLKTLDFSANHIPFGDEVYVGSQSFWGCPHLETLMLAFNYFAGVTEERFHELFGHLMHLTTLSLRATGLTNITAAMFRGLQSLQAIDLSENSLISLPDAAFQLLPCLVSINLASNKITLVQEAAFPFDTRQRLRTLDLRSNPFTCSCAVLPFQRWLLNGDVLAGSLEEYRCGNSPSTPVASFWLVEQACLLSPQTSQFIIATVCLVLLGMSLFVCLYRYRWHIRLVLFEIFRGPDARQRYLREHRFHHDVFVAYDSADFPWVRDNLMPSLEDGMGLKLCLHQRDFIPGTPIVDNIQESVVASQKMLMLFSRQFAQSQWCQFELQLCLTHAMDTQDVLIVALLEDIPSRELTSSMMAVMKTTTYIEWADEAEARDSFWRRMGLAVHEILPLA